MVIAHIINRSLNVSDHRYDSEAFGVLLDYLNLGDLAIQADLPDKLPGENEAFTLVGTAELFSQTAAVELDVTPRDNGSCDFFLVTTLPNLPQGILPPSVFVQPLENAPKVTFTPLLVQTQSRGHGRRFRSDAGRVSSELSRPCLLSGRAAARI